MLLWPEALNSLQICNKQDQIYLKPIQQGVQIPGDVGATRAHDDGLRSRDGQGAQIDRGRCNT